MTTALIMLLALTIDTLIGWPARLFAAIGHPVTWLGRLIGALDRALNREGDSVTIRRAGGVVAALAVIGLAFGAGTVGAMLLPPGWQGIVLGAVLAWPLVAARSMHDHVLAVARPLAQSELPAARHAVAMIVGRDPARLDAAGVSRAALESLAENTSDGITAPLFWGAVLGLPGIAAYKAINTLDSMIGHRTPRHEAFGWAAARIDDLANLIPARLTGLAFAATCRRPVAALRVMRADAGHHRSPNAGWPEAALAGALHVRLSGPRIYAGRLSNEPWVNEPAPDPGPDDILRGLRLYRRALLLMAACLALAAL